MLRSRDVDPSPDEPPYVLLEADGWQLQRSSLEEPGSVRAIRAYGLGDANRATAASALLVYGPAAAPPSSSEASANRAKVPRSPI